MLAAAVGDDVYGEDPTVIELERRTAEILGKESASKRGVRTVPPETNIVAFSLEDRDAAGVVLRARALGVLVNATGELSLRAVTHLDVTLEQVKRAGERLCEAISS